MVVCKTLRLLSRRIATAQRCCAAIAVVLTLWSGGGAHAADAPNASVLALSLSAESDGSTENSARLDSGEYLLLLRARSAGGRSPEYSGGFESTVFSLGALSPRGLERTLERPLGLRALSDDRLLPGGYRLRRSGGYGEFPDAAIRVGPVAAFRRGTERFSAVGLSLAGTVYAADTRPVVARFLAARSVPASPPEQSDWVLDRPQSSGGPLWFFGVEATGPSGYAGVVLSAGDAVRSSVLATVVGDVRIGAADLRAMLGGVLGTFVGADGSPSDTDALGGLQVSLPRGRLVRPLARSQLRIRTAAAMPREVIPRSTDSHAGVELGPESLFVEPKLRARTDLSADRVKGRRHDLSVRLRIAGARSRADFSVRRAFDDREAGSLEARIETRLALGTVHRESDGANAFGAANNPPGTDLTLDAVATVTRADSSPGDLALVAGDADEPQISGRLRLTAAGERLEAGMRLDVADGGIAISRLSELVSSPLAWSAGTIFVRIESEIGR